MLLSIWNKYHFYAELILIKLKQNSNKVSSIAEIECPYCSTINDMSKILGTENLVYTCGECGEEIWENIQPIHLFIEAFYFVLNALIYFAVLFISVNFYSTYPEWRGVTGFTFATTIMLASVSLHEFFHAVCAFVFGDFSIYRKKYLRLNIIHYLHGSNSLLLPFMGFVLSGIVEIGAAVYVNEARIKHAFLRSIVYVSGVFSQIIFLLFFVYLSDRADLFLSSGLIPFLHFAAGVQVILLFFNLLPIPGLDGWNAVFCFLPFQKLKDISTRFSTLFIIIFVVCLVTFDALTESLYTAIFSLMEWFKIDSELLINAFYQMQLIDFETLQLIKDRLFKLLSVTLGLQ